MMNSKIPYQLISKHLGGETSAEEDKMLWDWLDEDQGHLEKFEEIVMWYSGLRNETTATAKELESTLNQIYEQSSNEISRRISWPLIKMAASILIVAIVTTLVILNTFRNDQVCVQTRGGEKKLIILPDSSMVWLNGNTKLVYGMEQFNAARKVSLSGEAFFKVQEKSIPFKIDFDSVHAEVLYGSLNVEAYDSEFESVVVVSEGRVTFTDALKPEVMIRASDGEEVLSVKQYGLLSSSINENVNFDAWLSCTYVFDKLSVSSILALLEKGNGPSAVVLDKRMRHKTISGVYEFRSASSVDDFLNLLF